MVGRSKDRPLPIAPQHVSGRGRPSGRPAAPIVNDPSAYAIVLWLFTALLVSRVLGQLIVAVRAPAWLPPMPQWQSGLVPYPLLLACQAVVLALMVSI